MQFLEGQAEAAAASPRTGVGETSGPFLPPLSVLAALAEGEVSQGSPALASAGKIVAGKPTTGEEAQRVINAANGSFNDKGPNIVTTFWGPPELIPYTDDEQKLLDAAKDVILSGNRVGA